MQSPAICIHCNTQFDHNCHNCIEQGIPKATQSPVICINCHNCIPKATQNISSDNEKVQELEIPDESIDLMSYDSLLSQLTDYIIDSYSEDPYLIIPRMCELLYFTLPRHHSVYFNKSNQKIYLFSYNFKYQSYSQKDGLELIITTLKEAMENSNIYIYYIKSIKSQQEIQNIFEVNQYIPQIKAILSNEDNNKKSKTAYDKFKNGCEGIEYTPEELVRQSLIIDQIIINDKKFREISITQESREIRRLKDEIKRLNEIINPSEESQD